MDPPLDALTRTHPRPAVHGRTSKLTPTAALPQTPSQAPRARRQARTRDGPLSEPPSGPKCSAPQRPTSQRLRRSVEGAEAQESNAPLTGELPVGASAGVLHGKAGRTRPSTMMEHQRANAQPRRPHRQRTRERTRTQPEPRNAHTVSSHERIRNMGKGAPSKSRHSQGTVGTLKAVREERAWATVRRAERAMVQALDVLREEGADEAVDHARGALSELAQARLSWVRSVRPLGTEWLVEAVLHEGLPLDAHEGASA